MPSQEKTKPILVGIVVDISSSMSKNWKNRDGRELPRIEVIKDAINKELRRISSLYNQNRRSRKADIFCIGLGFRLPLHKYHRKYIGNYQPLITRGRKIVEHLDSICDLLALSEIVPTRSELSQIETDLNKKWNIYAKKILEQAEIEINVYDQLKLLIQNSLYEAAHYNLNNSGKNKLYIRLINNENLHKNIFIAPLTRYLRNYIQYWRGQINNKSKREAERYFESIVFHSKVVFERSKIKYEKYITQSLERFVAEQAEQVLSALAIGYTVPDVVELFKEQQAYEIAREIYHKLEQDVKLRITHVWTANKIRLFIRRIDIKGSVQSKRVAELTEKCVQKCTWELLEPLVKSVVKDLFSKSFRQQATIMLPQWISMASSREVTRSINQISNAFPDVYEEDFYSSTYVFGNTPMSEALERASVRMLDDKYRGYLKTLVIISDGEYVDNKPITLVERLKHKGVKIIGCCVTDKNILSELRAKASSQWPEGAKTLFHMSSIINLQDEFEVRVSQIVEGFPDGMKMFIQLNQSETLEELLNAILVDEDMPIITGTKVY